MPFRPPPIPLGQMDARQQATYFAQQGIQATGGAVKTFTPTWTGFSVAPTGDLSYYDLGALVILWAEEGVSGGTSNAASMTLTNLPSEITPQSFNKRARCLVVNNGSEMAGYAEIQTDGDIQFALENTGVGGDFTNHIGFTTDFVASGNKGLPIGWLVMYPK